MSEEASKRRSRLVWWLSVAAVVVGVLGMAFLFRVPLALAALRRGVAEPQAKWLVQTAGASAVP